MRSICSYAKVQTLVGGLIRNNRAQLARARVKNLRLLDLGCGRNPHSHFVNLDYLWHPGVDVCWDITRGLPFATASMDAVFTEHCLEHFGLSVAMAVLRECQRVLVPGGTLRIVVPDAETYLQTYCSLAGGDVRRDFPFPGQQSFEGLRSPILAVNRVFYQDRESPNGHSFMYDYHLLELLLRGIGFDSIKRESYRSGSISDLLIDSPGRAPESLYVEARSLRLGVERLHREEFHPKSGNRR